MEKFPQKLINVKVTSKDCVNAEPVIKALKHAEQKLKDTDRVLLRPSGTEPLIRVMVEGQDAVLITEVAQELAQAVSSAV